MILVATAFDGGAAACWRVAEDLAEEGGLGVRVRGGCMAPILRDGERVVVVRDKRYWPGDIVLVAREGPHMPFVHRLIGYYRSGGELRCLTQADNHATPDSSFSPRNIVGRVVGATLPHRSITIPLRYRVLAIGRFVRFLNTHLARFLWHSPPTT